MQRPTDAVGSGCSCCDEGGAHAWDGGTRGASWRRCQPAATVEMQFPPVTNLASFAEPGQFPHRLKNKARLLRLIVGAPQNLAQLRVCLYWILHRLDLLLSPCLCSCDPFLLECPACPCLLRLRSNATPSSKLSPGPPAGAILHPLSFGNPVMDRGPPSCVGGFSDPSQRLSHTVSPRVDHMGPPLDPSPHRLQRLPRGGSWTEERREGAKP